MFQDVLVENKPYYLHLAETIKKWNYGNIGIFVGATYPKEIKNLRDIFPNKIFLTAGLGAQSAEIRKTVKAGIDTHKSGIMFNSSRSIIYAKNPRQEALKLRDEINRYRQ